MAVITDLFKHTLIKTSLTGKVRVYSLIFGEMLLSRLDFSSELTSCGHWWLAWGKCYETFYSAFETLIEWLHDASDVHSCLFGATTSSKEDEMIVWTEVFIQRSVTPQQHLLFEFPEKIEWFDRYTCVLNRKNHAEHFQYTPNIYIYIYSHTLN